MAMLPDLPPISDGGFQITSLVLPGEPQAETLPWDPARPHQDRADAAQDFYNAGCPIGYFAQIVPPGAVDATDYGSPTSGIRCRLVVTATPETMVDEAAGDAQNAYENAQRFNAAASSTPAIPWALAGMAALGLLLWQRMQKKGT